MHYLYENWKRCSSLLLITFIFKLLQFFKRLNVADSHLEPASEIFLLSRYEVLAMTLHSNVTHSSISLYLTCLYLD
jgi:hypothetical protein